MLNHKAKSRYISQALRVNHAGEVAAKIIYHNQIKKAKTSELRSTLTHMLQQEEEHLKFFDNEIIKRKIRPTALMPLWHILARIVGSFSSSQKHMMIVTKAVEEVIEEHYQDQIATLQDLNENVLVDKIKKFMAEEVEHKDLATDKLESLTWSDYLISKVVGRGCKIAIALSKNI